MGQTHPEEWPLDSGCPVVVAPAAGGSSGAASVSGGGVDGASGPATDTDGGGGGGGKLVLGLVAVVIIGALVSRAKLMNRVSGTAAADDASIYKEDSGGSEVLSEETL